ncbi:MAG TPA: class I tRNA ligase family protein [Candidatus Paceibacterota bacterium]|nr:class I tRNA ligase family protein [Candidatus Paceibacterota bacterium]
MADENKENKENTTSKSESALREEGILKFWEENHTFQKTLQRPSPKGEFIFYEGPPTANGKPGIHHLEARAFKDVIPRYKTMSGYHVRRKGGWDTHGLPVELQVEKKLGLDSKKAIEEYGIAKFNEECKESVWEYVDLWEKFTSRTGYWLDQKDAYATYDNTYIESVWNILKHVDEQKLLYKDYKVVPWCPRCGTVLSSHELAQGYEDVKDLSVYAKFRLADGSLADAGLADNDLANKDTYILAWTTTPWTLPGNVALAVGEDIDYVKAKVGEEVLILAKERISILPEGYEILEEIKGAKLVGLEYEPLYPFLAETISETEKPKLEKAYKIYSADFVTTTDGTGVVHTAVMYGQDDFALGTKIGLPKHHLVGLDGKFLPGTGNFEGRFVRDEDVAVDVIKDLASRNLLFKKEKYEHSYPHCWRCHTALIYYARDSWYIKMSDPRIKDKMISENKSINWEPAHIRDGRFGEWLREIKDWAISRERYWGTPLPVWECNKCHKREVIGSLEELRGKAKKSGNKYCVMRHGETDKNITNTICTTVNSGSQLTENGKKSTLATAENLKKENINIIITSEFHRTRATAEIVAPLLGIPQSDIVVDPRLGEIKVPSYEGKSWTEYHKDYPHTVENFTKAPEGNESYEDVRARLADFLCDIESKYQNKNILIITHGAPSWLMTAVSRLLDVDETLKLVQSSKDYHYLANSEAQVLPFSPFPHDGKGNLDLHRPYIDNMIVECECGGTSERVKEVVDVWFDSGAMPFAQDHYPFKNKKWVDGPGYPADYISEAIDQTRGWFYTLHAIGVLLGKGKAYKNVICLGHLLDSAGKKMSKSLGNIVDPWIMIEKYGVDTLRLWMYSVNQPGESKNFDEKTVTLVHRQFFGLLYNVLSFYELYREKDLEKNEEPKPQNVLDIWIIVRLHELVELCTKGLNEFKLIEPVRAIRDFIDDLSTWYLRRSRERIKEGDKEAKATLYYVLRTLSQLLAPFAPFSAEDIWQKLRREGDEGSVHLSTWPKVKISILRSFTKRDTYVIEHMIKTREIVTLGLEARQRRGIKVRQPLGMIRVKDFGLPEEYAEVVRDELNVKEIRRDPGIKEEVHLETEITPELRQEGDYREVVRAIQDLRKKIGLMPNDLVTLTISLSDPLKSVIEKYERELSKVVGATEIKYEENDGEESKIGDETVKIKIQKRS